MLLLDLVAYSLKREKWRQTVTECEKHFVLEAQFDQSIYFELLL